jgi:hypothetical protein
LELFVNSKYEISAPQCPTPYTPDGRGDVLDIVVHQAIFTNILDPDCLPIMFSILDHVRMREALDSEEKLTDWVLFQIFVSELVSSV